MNGGERAAEVALQAIRMRWDVREIPVMRGQIRAAIHYLRAWRAR